MTETNATRAAGSSAPSCSACPFCGAVYAYPRDNDDGEMAVSAHVVCQDCEAQGPRGYADGRTPINRDQELAEAVRMWNERPNAEAHGRRSRTVKPLVGASESGPKKR